LQEYRSLTLHYQTRQKFKEAFDIFTAATIERAEKQAILARQARRLVNLLDDTPVVPGDTRPAFADAEPAREVLNDAEEELRGWTNSTEPIHSSAVPMGSGPMSGVGATDENAQIRNRSRSGSEAAPAMLDATEVNPVSTPANQMHETTRTPAAAVA
jgi:hypothetical protein